MESAREELPKNVARREQLQKCNTFLTFDRVVLRYYLSWDDRETAGGDVRKFILCYFKADDTMEISEEIGRNAGRTGKNFLKRQKVFRSSDRTTDIEPSDLTKPFPPFYTEDDLVIGGHIRVFSRDFLIYDADPFTKNYVKRRDAVQTPQPVMGEWNTPREVSNKYGWGF